MATGRCKLESVLESLILQYEEDSKNEMTTTAYTENQKTDQQQRTSDRMSELPCHVAMDIFGKLPIQSIVYCRRVCKAWRDLILDPRFTRLHLKSAPILMFQFDSVKIYMVEPDACDGDAITKVNNCCSYMPTSNTIRIVGSCNGLLCFQVDGLRCTIFHISNPLTGECMTIPKIKAALTGGNYLCAFGFGFSSKTNLYKVIAMRCPQKIWDSSETSWHWHMEVEIYTVGTATWRSTVCPAYHFLCGSSGIFLNGTLHWLALDVNHTLVICSFDIGNEQFQTIPMPPFPISSSDQQNELYRQKIGQLGGCLCIHACENLGSHSVVLWMMKDYGIKESWTKELVFEDRRWQYSRCTGEWVQLIRYSRNKETLLLHGYRLTDVISWDPKTGNSRRLNDHGSRSRIRVFHHIPSFLSLEDVVMGEN
ncbi:hypothetical protein L1049_024359 [Liquidambar formosana]|uniref:F-box domain-containing protein n=1 Tax=Liquidambar formosana TaxID=63359 RepID=A0AAP0X4I6_LIQFO